jgi:hypothetical protein
MNAEQEKIAEEFINLLKNNSGQPVNYREFADVKQISKQQMHQVNTITKNTQLGVS